MVLRTELEAMVRFSLPVNRTLCPFFIDADRYRCTVVIVAALGCGINGTIGSRKRLETMTFGWQMKQPIGVANPNAFTAYFLPRYVSVALPQTHT
jgi:hypothetical protein